MKETRRLASSRDSALYREARIPPTDLLNTGYTSRFTSKIFRETDGHRERKREREMIQFKTPIMNQSENSCEML